MSSTFQIRARAAMRRTRFSPLALPPLLALLAAPALAQSPPPSPCSSTEHRQFDFWLGAWEVRGPAGKVAGTNRITRTFGACVLHEQYDTGHGYSGSSFNIYDAGRGRWHPHPASDHVDAETRRHRAAALGVHQRGRRVAGHFRWQAHPARGPRRRTEPLVRRTTE